MLICMNRLKNAVLTFSIALELERKLALFDGDVFILINIDTKAERIIKWIKFALQNLTLFRYSNNASMQQNNLKIRAKMIQTSIYTMNNCEFFFSIRLHSACLCKYLKKLLNNVGYKALCRQ
jgi:5S rRNA maturation endonuclease (ribonuclease M5)